MEFFFSAFSVTGEVTEYLIFYWLLRVILEVCFFPHPPFLFLGCFVVNQDFKSCALKENISRIEERIYFPDPWLLHIQKERT